MLRKLWRVLRWWELLIAPWIIATLTFFFLAPRLTSALGGLIALTLIVTALSSFAAGLHVFDQSERRLARALMAQATVVALVAGAGWALLFRRPPPSAEPVGERGVTFERLQLSTGKHLAVARLPGDGQRPPVVFLHGGPGRPVSAADATFFKSLSEKGIEVVLFDQGGVGESDPIGRAEISLERAIAELEALRVKLGAEKISLVGQSWGARLAVEYAGRHRARVDRLVVTGGAPLSADPAMWKFDNRRTAHKEDVTPPGMPVIMAALVLHKTNPAASEAFASREDLNGLMASIVPMIMKRSICPKDAANAPSPRVGGLDGSQFLLIRGDVENLEAPTFAAPPPTLVLRPQCDFVAWPVVRDYRDRLKAKVLYVEGAGHALWPYQGELARDAMVAFFKDEGFPLAPYEGDADPAGE
jgi:proline iminopeptidase